MTIQRHSLPDAAAAAEACARRAAGLLETALAGGPEASLAVSGGSTPRLLFQALTRLRFDWSRVHLFWVDERCVPQDHPESNYGVCRDLLLTKVPIPESNVFRMEGELNPEEAASRYESTLRNVMKLEGAESPAFDLVVLGMGPDGHTASLFPETDALNELGRLVVANHVPQKDTWRITLTWPVINQGFEVAFEVEGKGKTDVVAEVLTGPRDPERLPSQLIRPANGKLLYLLDEDAAAKLPPASELAEAKDYRIGTLEI